jgi:DNA repair photolyase
MRRKAGNASGAGIKPRPAIQEIRMSDNSKIEWCDATLNVFRGCSKVSSGCKHCYADATAARFHKPGQWGHGLDGATHHDFPGVRHVH